MQFGMIGLGRMGANMARRLRQGKMELAAFNRSFEVTQQLAEETGLIACDSIDALIAKLDAPRIVWLMLPAGDITEQHIDLLTEKLDAGDLVVDGGNAFFEDDTRHAKQLAAKGIDFVDAGVSGGIWGLENGYTIMYGGAEEPAQRVEPYIKALAPAADRGWLHCGPVGSGHFVKMVHNGIEYGMMQAFAEGFAIMKGREDFDLDLAKIAEMWRHGSVVRSWLLDLTADFLKEDQDLAAIKPFVSDSGEGRWTAIEAINQGIPAPVITTAIQMRFASQGNNDYPAKLLAMMRKGFGGHAIKESK